MTLQFPMWDGSHKRLLSEVLAGVPANTRWRLRWFDGVVAKVVEVVPPQDRDIDLALSHAELLHLASNLEDLNEILLAGVSGQVHFQVECVDSSLWTISHEGGDGETVGSWFYSFTDDDP